MIYRHLPNLQALQPFLRAEKNRQLTYAPIGKTSLAENVPGFDNDYNDVCLGKGVAVFEAAKAAIRDWKMFPPAWTVIQPKADIRKGETVSMCARAFGLWWRNSCQIVYIVDEPQRFGFAYGTLPGHVEMGEELFLVKIADDQTVHYVLKAFSRPRHWMARIGYPAMRHFQRRFQRESKQAMVDAVNASISR